MCSPCIRSWHSCEPPDEDRLLDRHHQRTLAYIILLDDETDCTLLHRVAEWLARTEVQAPVVAARIEPRASPTLATCYGG